MQYPTLPWAGRQQLHGAQICVLDGNSYDAKCLEAGQERDDDLDACSLLINNKNQPLLAPGSGGIHNASQKVVVGLSVCASARSCSLTASDYGACHGHSSIYIKVIVTYE